MKRIAVASSLILLSACANNVWVKPGATQSEFAQQKYACMEQSQHRVSSAYINQYGGSSDSYVTTNSPLFNACMNSQGWYLQDKQQQQATIQAQNAGSQALVQEAVALCARVDLQPHYAKSPCKPEETTLEQLTDKSRITPSEKEALAKVRAESAAILKRMNEYVRQNDLRNGAAFALAMERAAAEQETVTLAFYEGRITRGEYNKKRREIVQQLQEQLRVASR
jgi:hypothetical protein